MTFLSFIKSCQKKVFLTILFIFIANILSLALPWGIKIIVDDVLVRKDTRLLHMIMLGLVMILCTRSVFNFLRKRMSNLIGEKIVCDLRAKIYQHTRKLSLQSIKRITPAQILTRITGDVETIRRFIFGDIIDFIYAFLSIGFIIIVLVWINPRLTIVALVTLPVFGFVYFRLLPRLKTGYERLRDITGIMTARINEVLNGITMVRSFMAENYEKKCFLHQQDEIFSVAKKNHTLNVGLWIVMEVFSSVGVIGVLWIGGLDVIHQRMSIGELVAFYSYLGMLFAPIIRMVMINSSYQEAAAALNRINEILKVDDEVSLVASPIILSHTDGNIDFRNVCFGYGKENILTDITFSVKAGETIGIVGASGAGKTTIINMLMRFFDPQKGKICIDGHDLKSLDLHFYRQQVAVVLQDDYLFSGTIRENIMYGSFDASLKEVQEVAKIAWAHSFISSFHDGYETRVGDRGMRLSSGQRQRLAMARALLRNPTILILDEATSALDAITENQVQESISRHLKGRTIFIVAHRFSTIMQADRIIVVDKGRIVESGEHSALLKKQGFYSRLYFEQFKEDDVRNIWGEIERTII